jgi:hypothetical protein
MSTRKQRDPLKERYWRRMLRDWRRSGLTIRAFCRLHDLSEPSFYSWRRMLADREAQAPTFVPVQLFDDDPATQPGAAAAGGLELFVGGRLLRIGPSFDGPTLLRLLAVLEQHQP